MDIDYIINAANRLNRYETADRCIDEVKRAVNTEVKKFDCPKDKNKDKLAEYYDTAVTVFVMAVNRSLYLAPDAQGEFSEDYYESVDKYADEISEKFDDFIRELKKKKGKADHEMFCDYLEKLKEYIFTNYKKHKRLDINSSDFYDQAFNDFYLRQNEMYRNMLELIAESNHSDPLMEFTEKYKIQIPYMYILVHDFSYLLAQYSGLFLPEHLELFYTGTVKICSEHIKNIELLKIINFITTEIEEDEKITTYDRIALIHLLPNIGLNMSTGRKDLDRLVKLSCNQAFYLKAIKDSEYFKNVPLVPSIVITINRKDYLSLMFKIFKVDLEEDLLIDQLIEKINNLSDANLTIKLSLKTHEDQHAELEKANAELEKANAELKKANAELKQAQEDRAEVIRDFAHTYNNLSVTQLYEIATVLLKDESYRDYGKRLLIEYETKQNLTKEVEMVRLKFEDRIDELYAKITDSLSDDRETAVTVRGALDVAFRRCLVTAFHSKSGLGETLRDSFDEIPGFDINEAENSFDNNVICGDGVSCADWVCGNLFPLKVTVSSEWEKVLMKNESYAVLMLISILAELIQNMLKYADLPKGVDIGFEDAGDILIVRFQNSFSKDANCRRLKNSGEGLASKNSVLQTLNKAAGCDNSWKAVETQSEENRFTTVVRVKKNLFIREEHGNG